MAAGADAVLIPDSIDRPVAQLGTRPDAALLVVAEGAYAIRSAPVSADPRLSPGQARARRCPTRLTVLAGRNQPRRPDCPAGGVTSCGGAAAPTMPLVLDQLVRGGDPSLDHVLAMAAAAGGCGVDRRR